MIQLNEVLTTIVDGIQEKKGRRIRVVDLTGLEETICSQMVICEGNSPNQVSAIAESVGDLMRERLDLRPLAVDGMRNCFWVAMDFADVVVHVFVPDFRAFYDIDNLWEDADCVDIPDLD